MKDLAQTWVPLHVHSQYSILNSTASLERLIEKAKEEQIPSLALTDFGNMHGAIDFFKGCKAAQIKPILGLEIAVAPFSRLEKKKRPNHAAGYPLVLLAKGIEGYKNLCKLSSIASIEGFYFFPRVDKETLEKYSKDLICLSGPIQSYASQMIIQGKEEEFTQEIDWALSVYGSDFYLQMERDQISAEELTQYRNESESWLYQKYVDHIEGQNRVVRQFVQLAEEKGIPYVATSDVRYLEAEDWEAHELFMNIQSGQTLEILEKDSYGKVKSRRPNPKRKVMPTRQLYFKSPSQMGRLFSDLPQAIQTSKTIADQCDLNLDFNRKYYPVFTPPHLEGTVFDEKERIQATEVYLKRLCKETIPERYPPERLEKIQAIYPDQNPLDVVKKRLEHEIEVIISKGMCDYLLIVYDFIAWAKRQKIPVGPGRGSGAGSIILYLIGITNIEPLQFGLFFERFINPERESYPDIDVDICMDRRFEVIDYTLKKYGKDRVAQIITFGKMKAKMVLKDVGRVLDVSLSKVNKLAKLVPEELNITLEKALAIDCQLKEIAENDEEVKRIFAFAQKLEGSIRSTGVHAAGLILCGDPLTDHIPLCCAKDSDMVVTQYAMKPVESVGMLKIDFLGLKTLTSIQKTVDFIQETKEKKIDWMNLPLEDRGTFELLNQGKTLGIFQLESSGMQELAKQLSIDRFEEIIAVTALYRPGPMKMIPSFIDRKHKRAQIETDHPLMEGILKETYGIMVYQEQVMHIAQKLANYSLGEGDILRRAMGKKDHVEMANQREKFQKGAKENGIDQEKAIEIFDKIEKFASYGFNKSHAAAYAYLTYVTAFLKANYPKEWLAALMTCDRDDLSKVAKHIREASDMKIDVLLPDINEAGLEFRASHKGIRFAMSGIKGVGKGVVEAIVKEREKSGTFESIGNFFKRVDVSTVGKKSIENLIEAGSFDFTGWDRKQLLKSVAPLFKGALRRRKEKIGGVLDFFADADEEEESIKLLPKTEESMNKGETLAREKELLGFYLTGHPMDDYQARMDELGSQSFQEIKAFAHGTVCKAAFIIESVSVRISSKTQSKFAILTISDGNDRFELPIWSALYEEKKGLLSENRLIFSILQVDRESGLLRLRCHGIEDLACLGESQTKALEEVFERASQMVNTLPKKIAKIAEKIEFKLDIDQIRFSHIVKLKKMFHKFAGDHPVALLFYTNHKLLGTLEIEPQWGIRPHKEFTDALKEFSFIQSFSFEG